MYGLKEKKIEIGTTIFEMANLKQITLQSSHISNEVGAVGVI